MNGIHYNAIHRKNERMRVMICEKEIAQAVDMIIESFRSGGRLYVCGNGGSAADSAHIVGELVKGFMKKRPLPEELSKALDGAPLQMGLPAIDLTAQSAVIAAINNDQGGECVYAQQVLAYGRKNDVLIGISTSGNAKNVILAMKTARLLDMKTISLTGIGGGKMKELSDCCIRVPESETYRVQELHLPVYHEICARVESAFYEE